MRPRSLAASAALVILFAAPSVATAGAATTTLSERFRAADGVELQTTLTGEAPLAPRPVIVEFSPYGRASGTFDAGAGYNHLLVQIRGTGDSHGRFDALGPRTQRDVAEVLAWACKRPWSNGQLGLNGFSASAITIYNSLHARLPCVKAAVLKSGTHELYRDLLYPGGVSNLVPGTVVLAAIGGASLAQGADRDPASAPDAFAGNTASGLGVLQHPTLDGWWRERGFRGDVNRLPILMVAGFYDVESRGAFEAYRALKRSGAHLYVIGAHDARPKGTDGGAAEMKSWFDRYVRGVPNGVERHPRVQMWMSDGDRRTYADGRFVRYDATDWPVPGTRWTALALDPARSGTARSINDGTLAPKAPATPATEAYPAAVSFPTMTDVPNAAIVDASGGSALTAGFPFLTDMRVAEPLGLSYTSAPLTRDVLAAGPAALDLRLASTAPQTPIWAVISDVAPDGTPNPVGLGRLSTDFPDIDFAKSLKDPRTGDVVQPYGRYDRKQPATPGQSRRYHVELWPLGNRFKAGHRIRLHLTGSSLASVPGAPGVNVVTSGGASPSRLLIPGLPPQAVARPCDARRVVTMRVPRRHRGALRGGTVSVDGRRVARLSPRRTSARIVLRARSPRRARVRMVLRLASGRTVTATRTFRLCQA